MHLRKFFFLILLFVMFVSQPLFSIENEKTEKEDELDFFVVPVAFYTSDSSFMFGGFGIFSWEAEHKDEDIGDIHNSVAVGGMYSLKNQMLFTESSNLYFKNGFFNWKNIFAFSIFPADFYGIGNDTYYPPENKIETYTPLYFKFENHFNFLTFRNLYIGLKSAQGYFKLMNYEKEQLMGDFISSNKTSGIISGFGPDIMYDSRDNSFYPESGQMFNFTSLFTNKFFLSDYIFNQFKLNYAFYYSVFPKFITAWQFYAEGITGKPPIIYMPDLGGAINMRGYPKGRYIDDLALTTQLELRFPVYWRFGGAVFGSIGKVQKWDENPFIDLHAAGGFGLRFMISEKKKINFRLDFGFTSEDFKVYFMTMEAF